MTEEWEKRGGGGDQLEAEKMSNSQFYGPKVRMAREARDLGPRN